MGGLRVRPLVRTISLYLKHVSVYNNMNLQLYSTDSCFDPWLSFESRIRVPATHIRVEVRRIRNYMESRNNITITNENVWLSKEEIEDKFMCKNVPGSFTEPTCFLIHIRRSSSSLKLMKVALATAFNDTRSDASTFFIGVSPFTDTTRFTAS